MKKSPTKPSPNQIRQEAWFNRLTRDHFARQIESPEELEPPIRDALLRGLAPGEHLRGMIYAPFQGKLKRRHSERRWFQFSLPWEFTPDWLLALTDQRLLLVRLNDPHRPPEVAPIPIRQILYLQSGVILLLAWLQIHWVEGGQVHQETIYFNSVCETMFKRLAEMIRQDLLNCPTSPAETNTQRHPALDDLPYKFMNMIPYRLLLPGEPVCRVLYRRAMWRTDYWFFNRMTAPALALVLTDGHLLLAEEDLTGIEGDYGLISTFLPLNRLQKVAVEEQSDFLQLLIELTLEETRASINLPFPPVMEPELREFAKAVIPVR